MKSGRPIPLTLFFYFLKTFLMWTILKVFIEFVTILLLLYVLVFFGCEACEAFGAPQPGIELACPALEGKVLTTGLPGKSLFFLKSASSYPSSLAFSYF